MQQPSLPSRLSELCVVDDFWFCQAIKLLAHMMFLNDVCSGLGMFGLYIKCLSIFRYHTGFQYRSFPFQEMGSATISFKCM
jgi:hypothetical protein